MRRKGARPARSFSVSLVWVWLSGLLFAGFITAVVYATRTYLDTMSRLNEYSNLVVEVDHLRKQNLVLQELELELRELKEFQRKMLRLAGIKPALSDLRSALTAPEEEEGLFASSGLLLWPVEGDVLQEFGPQHPGMDLAASKKTTVAAAGGGVVTHADRDSVLGPRLVLAHDDSLTTVYANNELLVVAVGDTVRAGDVIALSGTGFEGKTPHLHFEVRVHDVPVNPQTHIPDLFEASSPQ